MKFINEFLQGKLWCTAGIQVLQPAAHLQPRVKPLDTGCDGQLPWWHCWSWCDHRWWLHGCLWRLSWTWQQVSLHSMLAPCRLRHVMRPWFDFWFWCSIYCLLVYIVCFSTYPFSSIFLTCLLPYLSFPLRINPLHFQEDEEKMRSGHWLG